jgi:hypothetical protein
VLLRKQGVEPNILVANGKAASRFEAAPTD